MLFSGLKCSLKRALHGDQLNDHHCFKLLPSRCICSLIPCHAMTFLSCNKCTCLKFRPICLGRKSMFDTAFMVSLLSPVYLFFHRGAQNIYSRSIPTVQQDPQGGKTPQGSSGPQSVRLLEGFADVFRSAPPHSSPHLRPWHPTPEGKHQRPNEK